MKSKTVKCIEADSRMVVARGKGSEDVGQRVQSVNYARGMSSGVLM